MVYYAHFHSLMNYGIIFWGNRYYSNNIFRLQKKVVRNVSGIRHNNSCRYYFKSLSILTLKSQYLLLVLSFVANNMNLYETCAGVHGNNTRRNTDLYHPSTRLSI